MLRVLTGKNLFSLPFQPLFVVTNNYGMSKKRKRKTLYTMCVVKAYMFFSATRHIHPIFRIIIQFVGVWIHVSVIEEGTLNRKVKYHIKFLFLNG